MQSKVTTIFFLLTLLGATQCSDRVKHTVTTQSVCTQVHSRPTRDCRWHADLDMYADQEILNGCHVIAYKLQWFSGGWSNWFVTGINDIDGKVNLYQRRCRGITIYRNTMRRWWSYFFDHNHTYIKCCPRSGRPSFGDQLENKDVARDQLENEDDTGDQLENEDDESSVKIPLINMLSDIVNDE